MSLGTISDKSLLKSGGVFEFACFRIGGSQTFDRVGIAVLRQLARFEAEIHRFFSIADFVIRASGVHQRQS